MTEQGNGPQWQSSARGESAWNETKDRVATRNAEVRRSGRVERETYERERESVRRAAAARRHAQLLNGQTP